jgi:hypothetical protein
VVASPGLRTALPASGLLSLPGVRTFLDRRFRMIVGAVLLAIGVGLLGLALARSVRIGDGQTAIDFAAYHAAAAAVADGRSPYQPEMLAGPVPAQGRGAYRYPPPLAQLLVPLAGLPMPVAAGVWLVGQLIAVAVAVWFAGSLGGAPPSRERLIWTGVAATYFLPVFDSLWKGNVSGWLALATALALAGGLRAGPQIAAATLVKLTPGAILVPALLGSAVPDRRRLLLAAAATLIAVAGASIVISPGAWLDYLRVLPNLALGWADYPTNLAPAALVSTRLPGPVDFAPLVRLAALSTAVVLLVGSVVLARREGGWPAAVVAATAAGLLIPAALWYHYLCPLLPLGAYAWPRAGAAARSGLVLGGVLIFVGFGWWLPAALVGATLLVAANLIVLWPAARPVSSATLQPTRGYLVS